MTDDERELVRRVEAIILQKETARKNAQALADEREKTIDRMRAELDAAERRAADADAMHEQLVDATELAIALRELWEVATDYAGLVYHLRLWDMAEQLTVEQAQNRALLDEIELLSSAREWHAVDPKPADWETEYPIVLRGKTLEAMRYLASWALAQAEHQVLPFGVIGASDHLFCLAEDTRKPPAR